MDYYYSDGQNQFGPVSLEDLCTKIDANTLVWHDGMPNWDKASNVEELKAMFAHPTPPPIVKQIPVQTPINTQTFPKDKALLVLAIIGLGVCFWEFITRRGYNDFSGVILIVVLYHVAFSIISIIKSRKMVANSSKRDATLLGMAIASIVSSFFILVISILAYYDYFYSNQRKWDNIWHSFAEIAPFIFLSCSYFITFSIVAVAKASKKR